MKKKSVLEFLRISAHTYFLKDKKFSYLFLFYPFILNLVASIQPTIFSDPVLPKSELLFRLIHSQWLQYAGVNIKNCHQSHFAALHWGLCIRTLWKTLLQVNVHFYRHSESERHQFMNRNVPFFFLLHDEYWTVSHNPVKPTGKSKARCFH